MDDIGTKPTVRNKTISTSKFFGVDGKSSLGKVGQEKSKIGSLSKIVRNNRIKISQLEKNDNVLNSILNELISLRSTVNSIGKSIKKQQKLQQKVVARNKIIEDIQAKKSREEKLETRPSGKSKILEKAEKPVIGFFDRIIEFFKMILLGGGLSYLLNVIKDPQILLKPLQDLVNNVISFFNGIIEWIDSTLIDPLRSIVDSLNGGLQNIVNVLNEIISSIPDWMPFKPDAIEQAPQIPQIPSLPEIPKATFADPKVQAQSNGGQILNINEGNTIINAKDLKFKSGGQVGTDSGITINGLGPDTQLIAAQPGEIVMNKSAVDGYGADNLLSLNSIFGGSNANKPKMVSGGKIMSAQGGGQVRKHMRKGEKSSAQVKNPTTNTSQEKDVKKGVDDKPGSGGLPAVVSAGKQLLSSGFTVAEHPNFGKGTGYDPNGKQRVGGHSPNSAHYKNLAIDVTDWRDGDWKGRTKSLAQSMFEQKDKLKLTQIIHDPWGSWFKGESKPGAAIGGHPTHLHLAFENGPGGDIESTQGSDYSGKIGSSSGGSSGSKMGSSITPPSVSGGGMMPIPIPSGGKQSTQSSSAGSGQSPAPSFSSEDTMNPSLLVVKAIYNIVG